MNMLTVTAPEKATCGLYPNTPTKRDFSCIKPENAIPSTSASTKEGITTYSYADLEPGVYHCAATMEGYNSLCRLVHHTGNTQVEMKMDPLAGNGYEAGFVMLYSTEFEKNALQSDPDLWGPEYKKLFCTPQFMPGRPGRHQQTTNEEAKDFIAKLNANCEYMHVFSLGKSPKYGYDMPLVLFTREPVKNLTLEEAAKLVRGNGKPTIQYLAQCHSTEPASTEGALAMMVSLCGDYGKVLDSVDIYIIPRVNPDGAFEAIRVAPATGEDMNRDYLYMCNTELRMVAAAFNMFRPEIAIDGHEAYHRILSTENHICADLQVQTGAGSLNHPAEMTKLVVKMAKKAFERARSLGLRNHFFANLASAAGGAAGSSYFGTRNCLSFLAETPGQVVMGMTAMERRVMSQYALASSVIDYAVEHADEVMTTVHNSREYMCKTGPVYDENDLFVLEHKTLPTGTWSTPLLDVATGLPVDPDYTLQYQEQPEAAITRTRPTAYVIEKGLPEEKEILRLACNHDLEYYTLPAGKSISLQQYKKTEEGIELSKEESVCFENGALVFPNTIDSTVLCVVMEPDFNPSNPDRKMTLLRMGLIAPNQEGMLPLYRYCHTLIHGKVSEE